MSRHFFKEGIQMASRHIKKMLNITHHQGNTNQNHNEIPVTPVRMADINNSRNNRHWQGCRERGSLLHCWWECMLVQLRWKTVRRFLKKLKTELSYDPALLGIYPRDTGMLFWRGTCTPTFIAALSRIAKVWKEPKCPLMDICLGSFHTLAIVDSAAINIGLHVPLQNSIPVSLG